MNGKLRTILIVAAALLLAAAAVVFGGGALVARSECRKPLRIPEAATLVPETVAGPGAPALAAVEFTLPWGTAVSEAHIEAGGETAVSGAPQISSKWKWGKRLWRVEATLRPLDSRGTAPGKLAIVLDRPLPGAEAGRCEVAVPALKVASSAAEVASRPRLADPEETPAPSSARWRWYLVAAGAVVAAAASLWFVLRRRARRRTAPQPPWEIARAGLAELRSSMAARNFRAERGVARLSDILKDYLTARFDIPAATETGSMFLDGAAGDLTPDELGFLRGFFAAADLVKFARIPADRAELERAVAAASVLVERTVPPPPERTAKEARS